MRLAGERPSGHDLLERVFRVDGFACPGLDLVMVRRPWDEALWPLASRGFFPFRERSEGVLRTLGLPV